MATVTVGDLLRTWRSKRGCSQLTLASEAGVSSRHLSFVETGRSRPSPELLLTLARHLQVPLRDQNTLLLAAGHAPRFSDNSIDDEAMALMRSALERVLETHDPYPGLVLDRHWNIVMMNRAASGLIALLPPELASEPINLFRASLHPDGMARYTTNLGQWAPYLIGELERLVTRHDDLQLAELATEVRSFVPEFAGRGEAGIGPVVTCNLDFGGVELSLFTTLTAFASPRDVMLDELLIELFFPADSATEQVLRSSG